MLPVLTMLVLTGLAGCADDQGSGASDPGGPAPLAAGTGAIQGLLVDDRFRPLELMDNPSSEFQQAGAILVQETGAEVKTNDAGEFLVSDLAPGTYTLRASVSGHEVTPMTVPVLVGELTDVTIIARRAATDDSELVYIQDDRLVISCSTQLLIGRFYPSDIGLGRACFGDLSQDGNVNLVYIQNLLRDDYSWFITEFTATQELGWEMWFISPANLDAGTPYLYDRVRSDTTDYIRVQHKHQTDAMATPDDGDFVDVDANDLRLQVHPNHFGSDETYDVLGFDATVGMTFQVIARFVTSTFAGEPAVDIDSYCVICTA